MLESWSDLGAICMATGQRDPHTCIHRVSNPHFPLIFLIFNYKTIQAYKYKSNMTPNITGKTKTEIDFASYLSILKNEWMN